QRDAKMVDVEEAREAAVERGEDAARRRQDEGGNREQADQRLPHRERRRDQHQPQHEAAKLPSHSSPPPALSAARMRRTCDPNASVVITSRLRGRGKSTLSTSAMRPGRGVITSTRSARNTASEVEWVTNSTVLRRSSQMRWSSTFIASRVSASSAPNGS